MSASSSSGEFALIDRHFRRPSPLRHATVGIGDDCALLAPLPDEQLAISTDMLVAGWHFFEDVDPAALGHKALAVNLSDLAACGAQPLGATLAIALPAVDDAWLEAFASGLFALADAHGCELVGGDTTRGPATTSTSAMRRCEGRVTRAWRCNCSSWRAETHPPLPPSCRRSNPACATTCCT